MGLKLSAAAQSMAPRIMNGLTRSVNTRFATCAKFEWLGRFMEGWFCRSSPNHPGLRVYLRPMNFNKKNIYGFWFLFGFSVAFVPLHFAIIHSISQSIIFAYSIDNPKSFLRGPSTIIWSFFFGIRARAERTPALNRVIRWKRSGLNILISCWGLARDQLNGGGSICCNW